MSILRRSEVRDTHDIMCEDGFPLGKQLSMEALLLNGTKSKSGEL